MQIPTHKIDHSKLFIKWRKIKMEPDSLEQAHRHNYFQFMFLEEVKGTHEIDFETYDAQNRSLHFVGKGRVHKVDFEPSVVGGVFLFPEELFDDSESNLKLLASLSFFKNGAQPTLKIGMLEYDVIKNLIYQIKKAISKDSFDVGRYLLFALLAKVRDIYNLALGMPINPTLPDALIAFNKLLKEKGCEWHAIQEFTRALHLTAGRLNNLCKQYVGLTALQMLHERKLLEAKRMLVYTDKQVKEIAYDCGFDDVAYFNRFFKKHVGATPGAFQKNH